MKVRVLITRRPGILDPEGRAVARALHDLGFDEVSGVGTGKLLVLDLPDSLAPAQLESRVREMCDKLLANPVMEQYAIERIGG
jgi:phosphoribosylformylglycinamidine synthase subunit PurS